MVTHTIEELHELFKSGELDVKEYYKENHKNMQKLRFLLLFFLSYGKMKSRYITFRKR